MSDPTETPAPEYSPDKDIVVPEIREGEGRRAFTDGDLSSDE